MKVRWGSPYSYCFLVFVKERKVGVITRKPEFSKLILFKYWCEWYVWCVWCVCVGTHASVHT